MGSVVVDAFVSGAAGAVMGWCATALTLVRRVAAIEGRLAENYALMSHIVDRLSDCVPDNGGGRS